jgi:hypothetical protein
MCGDVGEVPSNTSHQVAAAQDETAVITAEAEARAVQLQSELAAIQRSVQDLEKTLQGYVVALVHRLQLMFFRARAELDSARASLSESDIRIKDGLLFFETRLIS